MFLDSTIYNQLKDAFCFRFGSAGRWIRAWFSLSRHRNLKSKPSGNVWSHWDIEPLQFFRCWVFLQNVQQKFIGLTMGTPYLSSSLDSIHQTDILLSQDISLFTGLPVRPSHKMGFRSSVSKSGLPGEGRHEGLVPRNDVLTNGFIWVSLARSLARILFVPCLRSPWKTHKALRTWRRLFALFEAIRPWE